LGDQIFQPKKYIFSSLNGQPRFHRVLLASQVLKKPYLDKCCLTFNSDNLSWFDYQTDELLNFAKKYLPYRNADINKEYHALDHSNLNSAYLDSYVNIITETNIYQTFFTEKTFKALASGQFFILLGGAGSIELLKTFGFDTFDDIIDHGYDSTVDPYEKIQQISDLLDQLIKLDWPAIWQSTGQRRQKNVEHFFSNTYTKLLTPFEEKIKSL
jgi:hypothetical protein